MSGLLRYISEGEHQQQDFKMRIDHAKKIARTLAAFANTDGGRLLIGVKDNGQICGIDPEEELHMIEAAAQMYCRPPISFKTQIWKSEYKSVLEVSIPSSRKLPHFAINEQDLWRAYLRRDDQNIVANGVLLKVWEHKENNRPANFTYTAAQKSLFDYLQKHEQVGFRRVQRIVKLNPAETETLLAQLIAWDIICIKITDAGVSYALIAHTSII